MKREIAFVRKGKTQTAVIDVCSICELRLSTGRVCWSVPVDEAKGISTFLRIDVAYLVCARCDFNGEATA